MNGMIRLPPDSTGKRLDTSEVRVQGDPRQRQRVNLADSGDPTQMVSVTNRSLNVNVVSGGLLPLTAPVSQQPLPRIAVDGTIGLEPDSTGKRLDTSELTVGTSPVHRQRMVLADDNDPAGLVSVVGGALNVNIAGLGGTPLNLNPTNGDVLTYDTTGGPGQTRWVAKAPASVGGPFLPLTGKAADSSLLNGNADTAFATAAQGALAATALQSFTETDPTVSAWAKAATKPTYTAAEVGALPLAGGTLTGALILEADPTVALGAATKDYVDTEIASAVTGGTVDLTAYLQKAGGTMTGALVLHADPANDMEAATKQYVDNATPTIDLSDYLELAGGTMTGALTLHADPATDMGAATKQYVDGEVSGLNLSDYLLTTGKAADSALLNGQADTAFATAAQGGKADTALQPADLAVLDQSMDDLADQLNDIREVIPAQATTTNQLADKDFVNSAVAQMAANAVTKTAAGDVMWASLAEIQAGPWFHNGISYTPATNDYAIYDTGTEQWRAKYTGTQWQNDFKIGSSLTTAQQAALDSGITSTIVGTIADKVDKAGDTMTGALVLHADPANDMEAATKQYVDAAGPTSIKWNSLTDPTAPSYLYMERWPTVMEFDLSQTVQALVVDDGSASNPATARPLLSVHSLHPNVEPFRASSGSNQVIIDGSGNLRITKLTSTNLLATDVNGNIIAGSIDFTPVTDRLDDIESVIPVQASATNELADKDFVNSAVAAMAANAVTKTAAGDVLWVSLAEIQAGPWFHNGVSYTPATNDYAIYDTGTEQWRAKYTGTLWQNDFRIGSTLTSTQQAALDSGITSTIVGSIGDKVDKAGSTMTGALTLHADPTTDMEAATKQYVDQEISSATPDLSSVLALSGGTMTGNIDLDAHVLENVGEIQVARISSDGSGPVKFGDALDTDGNDLIVTPLHVDQIFPIGSTNAVAQVNSNGLELSQDLWANSRGIHDLKAPASDDDAATKKYVDDEIAAMPAGGIPDADSDGKLYGRKDGDWEEIPAAVTGSYLPLSGGTITGPTTFNSTVIAAYLQSTGSVDLKGSFAQVETSLVDLRSTSTDGLHLHTTPPTPITLDGDTNVGSNSAGRSLRVYGNITGNSISSTAGVDLQGTGIHIGSATSGSVFIQSGQSIGVTGNTSFNGQLAANSGMWVQGGDIHMYSAGTMWLQAQSEDVRIEGPKLTVNCPTAFNSTVTVQEPTQNSQPATKKYVDDRPAGSGLPLTGGTVTGDTSFTQNLTGNHLKSTGSVNFKGSSIEMEASLIDLTSVASDGLNLHATGGSKILLDGDVTVGSTTFEKTLRLNGAFFVKTSGWVDIEGGAVDIKCPGSNLNLISPGINLIGPTNIQGDTAIGSSSNQKNLVVNGRLNASVYDSMQVTGYIDASGSFLQFASNNFNVTTGSDGINLTCNPTSTQNRINLNSQVQVNGPLTLQGAPTQPNQAATKKYVDDNVVIGQTGAYLPLAGGASYPIIGRLHLNQGLNVSGAVSMTGSGFSINAGNFDANTNQVNIGIQNQSGVFIKGAWINIDCQGSQLELNGSAGVAVQSRLYANQEVYISKTLNVTGATSMAGLTSGKINCSGMTSTGSVSINGSGFSVSCRDVNISADAGIDLRSMGPDSVESLIIQGGGTPNITIGSSNYHGTINCYSITAQRFLSSSMDVLQGGSGFQFHSNAPVEFHPFNQHGREAIRTFSNGTAISCYWADGAGGAMVKINPGSQTFGGSFAQFTGDLYINGQAYKPSGGMWENSSDARLKTDVAEYKDGLEKLTQLKPIRYRFNDRARMAESNKVYIGLAAEEVKKVMPSMVGSRKMKLDYEDKEPTDVLTVDASELIYTVINALKQIDKRLSALEGKAPDALHEVKSHEAHETHKGKKGK